MTRWWRELNMKHIIDHVIQSLSHISYISYLAYHLWQWQSVWGPQHTHTEKWPNVMPNVCDFSKHMHPCNTVGNQWKANNNPFQPHPCAERPRWPAPFHLLQRRRRRAFNDITFHQSSRRCSVASFFRRDTPWTLKAKPFIPNDLMLYETPNTQGNLNNVTMRQCQHDWLLKAESNPKVCLARSRGQSVTWHGL